MPIIRDVTEYHFKSKTLMEWKNEAHRIDMKSLISMFRIWCESDFFSRVCVYKKNCLKRIVSVFCKPIYFILVSSNSIKWLNTFDAASARHCSLLLELHRSNVCSILWARLVLQRFFLKYKWNWILLHNIFDNLELFSTNKSTDRWSCIGFLL